jgi:hypothetical protein
MYELYHVNHENAASEYHYKSMECTTSTMIKNYKCGTNLVHDTTLYASGGRLRKVVNISTKRTARVVMYNATDGKRIMADKQPTMFVIWSGKKMTREQRQGVQVIATALIRHSTRSWYVGKAKNQAIQWMPPNIIAISNPTRKSMFLSESSRLMLPSNVGT